MEVRRLIRKPLQPARPIHRTVPDRGGILMVNCQAMFIHPCGDSIKDHCDLWPSTGNSQDIFKDPLTEETPENEGKGCELLLSNKMEVRSLIRKSLHPARPLRRTIPDNGDTLMVNFKTTFTDHYRDGIYDHWNLWSSVGNSHDVTNDLVIEESSVNNKKDRITYTRDYLLQLSTVSVSKQKPKYLPDLPVTLQYPSRVHAEEQRRSLFIPVYCPGRRLSHGAVMDSKRGLIGLQPPLTASCQLPRRTRITLKMTRPSFSK